MGIVIGKTFAFSRPFIIFFQERDCIVSNVYQTLVW